MITKEDLYVKDITHEKSGNGYIAIQLLPHDYVRLIPYGMDGIRDKKEVDIRAFLGWNKLCSVSLLPKLDEQGKVVMKDGKVVNEPRMIKKEIAEEAQKLGQDLDSGVLVVKETHVVKPNERKNEHQRVKGK